MTTQNFSNAVSGEVATLMAAEFPGVTVMFENGPVVDEASVGDMFLDVEVRWYGASAVAMGVNAPGRHTGTISLNVFYKQAEGTAAVGALIDRLIAALRTRRIGGGVTHMPQRTVPGDALGWYKSGVFVPFHLDN